MVVPASHTGDYAWGHTSDEPLQPLAHSPWVVRDAVPLGGPGLTRVLDAVEEVLRSGRGSPALAPFLARSGTRFLVVRNDLDLRATGSTRPFVVHAALGSSPGLRRVASFGPVVGPGFATGSTVYDAQLGAVYPAVEVFEVDPALAGGATAVTTWPVQGTRRVTGGPESVLPLLESGVLDPRQAVRLAGERDGRGEPEDVPTLTDGYRDREVDVGRATDGASATLGAGSERRLSRPVADYLPLPVAGNRARATLRGITWVSASSSAADADAFVLRGRDHNPSAAFDGQADTVWVSGGLVPVSQWVEARFPRTELAAVRVTAPPVVGIGARATRVRVTTDRSSTEVALVDGSATVPLDEATGRVRLTVTAVAGGSELGVTALEGVLVSPSGPLLAERGLRLARPASGATADLVLTAGRRDRPGCLVLGDRPVCAATLPQADEDDVAVDATALLPAAGSYDLAVRGRARGGAALDALLQQGQPITATASSAVVLDPGARAATVLDRDLRTSWIASPLDPAPTLHLRLAVPQRITGVTVVVDPELAASRPRAVALSVDGAPPTTVALDLRGVAPIPAVTGRDVTVTFPEVEPRWSRDIDGFIELLPVGVTELRVDGPPTDLRQSFDPQHRLEEACGQGPALTLDGRTVATTRVTTTVGDLLAGRDVSVVPCAALPVTAAAGEHRFRMARTELVQVTGVTLTEQGRSTGAASTTRVSGVAKWSAHRRLLDVAPGQESYLAVHEAFNTGWVARLDGRKLAAVRLDGWQQGFVLPETGGRVELTYQPDVLYRVALVAGAVLALLLVALALIPSRALSAEPRRRRRERLGPVLGLLVLPLVGGAAGLLVLLVVALVSRWRPARARLLGPAGLVGAGVVVALDPWPGGALVHGPAQALGLVTAACLAVSLWWPDAVGELPVRGSAAAWRAPRQPAARPTPPGG
jgi:arabinofuranan 3-O-arabinosyltransferase